MRFNYLIIQPAENGLPPTDVGNISLDIPAFRSYDARAFKDILEDKLTKILDYPIEIEMERY